MGLGDYNYCRHHCRHHHHHHHPLWPQKQASQHLYPPTQYLYQHHHHHCLRHHNHDHNHCGGHHYRIYIHDHLHHHPWFRKASHDKALFKINFMFNYNLQLKLI